MRLLDDKRIDQLKGLQNAAGAAGKAAANKVGCAAEDLAVKAIGSAQSAAGAINKTIKSKNGKHDRGTVDSIDAIEGEGDARDEAAWVPDVAKAPNITEAAGEFASKAKSKALDAHKVIDDALTAAKDAPGAPVDSVTGAVNVVATSARDAAAVVSGKAGEIADEVKQNIEDAKAKEPDEFELAVIDYNQTFTDMESEGVLLYQARLRSADLLDLVTDLVNSIANTPKSFAEDIEEISCEKKIFKDAETFALEELEFARKSAKSVGAGVAAGMAVASIAPSAAIWIATTFGTASTGAAISTLSGAAATNAALAWLGGGALAAGGGGMAAGNALLALAGPIGWGVAGATLLTSIALFAKKKHDLAKEKQEELLSIKKNTEALKETLASICSLKDKTEALRSKLSPSFISACRFYDADYSCLSDESKLTLGALVNNAKSLARLLTEKIDVRDGE